MKIFIRLPIFIIVWFAYLLFVSLPTKAIGLLVVPFLYKYRFHPYAELSWWTRPWSNLEDWIGQPQARWGEASLPNWWIDRRIAKGFEGTDFRSWYRYHARRNGANGLRSFNIFSVNLYKTDLKYWTPFYYTHYEPKPMREADKKWAFYIAWRGAKAGFKIVHVWPTLKKDIKLWKWTLLEKGKRHFSMKFGWRIHPHHIVEGIGDPKLMAQYPDRRLLYEHRGFASVFQPYRRG